MFARSTRWEEGEGTHVQHPVEQAPPVAHALTVAQHEEVEHAQRLHLVHLVLLVEKKQVLAPHLQHADHVTFPPATRIPRVNKLIWKRIIREWERIARIICLD